MLRERVPLDQHVAGRPRELNARFRVEPLRVVQQLEQEDVMHVEFVDQPQEHARLCLSRARLQR